MSTVNRYELLKKMSLATARRKHYEWKSEQPGKLTRDEVWRHTYLTRPYLIGASDDQVAERFCNIFMNVSEIGPAGKITLVSMSETEEYLQVFTHMLEEYGLRTNGYPPATTIEKARVPLSRYFEHGMPIGIKMFAGYNIPAKPVLVKYGKREFLELMFKEGKLRLSNAKSYNQAQHLDAVRDDETSRTFYIPTYHERLAGKTHISFDKHEIELKDEDIVLPLVFDDYYLFSLCEKIHFRMPTDFGADAAVVIRDPERFKQRLISAFLAMLPDWKAMEGPVIYYDPYQDYTKFRVPEMAKHFGYAYQKEVRIAFKPPQVPTQELAPLFLSIGSMEDYADLVSV